MPAFLTLNHEKNKMLVVEHYDIPLACPYHQWYNSPMAGERRNGKASVGHQLGEAHSLSLVPVFLIPSVSPPLTILTSV